MENERLWTRGFVLDTLINLGIYIIYYMLMVVIAVEALQMGATVAEAGLASGIYIIGVLLARLVGGRYSNTSLHVASLVIIRCLNRICFAIVM